LLIGIFHIIRRFFCRGALPRVSALLIFLCCYSSFARAQYFDLPEGKKRVTIPFRIVRDMIVIKLSINDKGPFNFILDTGVGLMLITDPKLVDSINVTNKRTIKISGLGEGAAYEAYVTSVLNVQVPGLQSYDIAAAILKTDHFGLSNFAGIPVHGLLGYEFFNNLAVKIDFTDSTLTVSRPKDVRLFRKGNKIPLSIENRKPYIQAKIIFPDGGKADDKLIVDLGAGHPLSLENIIKKRGLPKKFIPANLGVGLTGPIDGFLSRVNELDIGRFRIKNVITSFPIQDTDALPEEKRDGNLGMDILKRFTLIFDYPDSALYLKPGPNLNAPFEHDMSGLEYYSTGDDYKHVIISRVEPGSPADEVGLEKDDEIMSINFKSVAKMSLEDIDSIFKSQKDRTLLLVIFHDKKYDHVVITLKQRI
jgi:hypothetical protein